MESRGTNAGGTINALCFDESVDTVTIIDYDTNSAVRPELTMEVWYKPEAYPDNRDWLLAHDNGGFDRAIISYDNRFSGAALGVGGSYASTLGYPALGEWIHLVATYSKSDGVATLYQNGGDLVSGGSQQTVTVIADSGSTRTYVGLNGHNVNHLTIGCFARIQMTDRVLSAEEVVGLYEEFEADIGMTP